MASNVLNSMLKNKWSASTTAANVTATASVGSPGTQSRHVLETLVYSIYNKGVSTGLQFTLQAQVRHASVAGTLIFALDHNVPSSTVHNVQLAGLGIPGKRGSGLVAFFNTVIGSVTASMNIAGWTDDANG